MKKVSHALQVSMSWAGISLLLVSFILVVIEAAGRYLFGASAGWREEICRYTFLWGSWLMMGVAWAQKGHIVVDLLRTRIIKKVGKSYEIFLNLVSIFGAVLLFYLGFSLAFWELTVLQTSSENSHLLLGVVFAFLPLGMLILIFHIVEELIDIIRR